MAIPGLSINSFGLIRNCGYGVPTILADRPPKNRVDSHLNTFLCCVLAEARRRAHRVDIADTRDFYYRWKFPAGEKVLKYLFQHNGCATGFLNCGPRHDCSSIPSINKTDNNSSENSLLFRTAFGNEQCHGHQRVVCNPFGTIRIVQDSVFLEKP